MSHERLGYISKKEKRLESLVKSEILQNLYFVDLETCLDSIKEKKTKQKLKRTTRNTQFFEIIHINICKL